MMKHLAVAAAAILFWPALALANPAGVYDVVGGNTDGTSGYRGEVSVERTGETYRVTWIIAGKTHIGTGIGAKFEGDRFEMGPATEDDTAISVGYVAADGFGIAMFFEQPDGEWAGVWTYGGSNRVAGETWTRR